MSQHFLLTAAARTLSLASVARMSGEEAHAKFVEIRWSDATPYRTAREDIDFDRSAARAIGLAAVRRAEMGVHHRISGRYLYQYANEMAWREDHRREPNGLHFRRMTGAALRHPKSEIWRGYWQRSAA